MSESVRESAKKPEASKEDRTSQARKSNYSQPVNSSVDRILYLQRTIGNQAVGRLIKSGALQAKLKIGQPDDIYEQEADRVAEQVMRMPEPLALDGRINQNVFIQRNCPKCEEDEKMRRKPLGDLLQAQKVETGNISEITPGIEAGINALSGGGQPLSEDVRAFFEPRFGRDFSQVRVHADARAAESARAVSALAYTVGTNVVFGLGQYAPATLGGRRLLAHELTHTIQQEAKAPTAAQLLMSTSPEDAGERQARAASDAVVLASAIPIVNQSVRQLARQDDDVNGGSPDAGPSDVGSTDASLPGGVTTPAPSESVSSPPAAAASAFPSPAPAAAPVKTVKVWIHSFIPMASVKDPFGYCYSGDNRGFSSAIHASYRTHQEIEFDATTGAKTIDWSDTGTTHELDRDTCTKITGSEKAPTSGLVNGLVTRSGSVFKLHFDGTAKNPKAWYACAIDLEFDMDIDPATRACSLTGEHDGFPAYEVYVTANGGAGVTVYTYDPVTAGEGPSALCGGKDKKASGSASF